MFNELQNGANFGVDLDSICSTPELDNIGSDPYWLDGDLSDPDDIYRYVYTNTKKNMDLCEKHNKEHNLWLQTWSNKTGREEEIVLAADAIYDAGARTIFAWGYRGSDSVDYRSRSVDRTWYTTKAAFERITERHRNALRDAARKNI